MQLSGPRFHMGVRFGLLLALWRWGPELKDMLGVQMAFFRQLCHLRKSVTPYIIFRECAERP